MARTRRKTTTRTFGPARTNSGPPTVTRYAEGAAPEATSAFLVVIAGPDTGKMVRLEGACDITIGRLRTVEFVLSDEGVSRKHVRVTREGGRLVLHDLGSHNGTYVAGTKVDGSVELRSGDLVQIGGATTLKFSITDPLEEEYQRRMVSAATRDPLTGAFNRGHFDERALAEVAAANRHREPLSLLMIDLDHFKAVNDGWGHSAGDAVLKAVVAQLASAVREGDLVCRYGGEEFAVLLRGTDRRGAALLAERLRRAVEDLATPWPSVKGGLRVTISVGVAQLGADASPTDLVGQADGYLLAAKRKGRNRVVTGE